MLEAICAHLHNYFCAPADVCEGEWTIQGSAIDLTGIVVDGQYFRIVGSLFNDGVYQYPAQPAEGKEAILTDESFTGEIWPMRVPRAVLTLAGEIAAWQTQYGAAMASPYKSESIIGVYSYMKQGGNTTQGQQGSADAWKSVFRSRLNPWRKFA